MHKGYTLDQIADVLEVDRDAVSRTLDRWERGAESAALEEGHRPGRRPKVDAALEAEVLAAAHEQPASLRRTLAKRGALKMAGYATLKKVLRRARWRWRRTRRRTGKPPDTRHRVRAPRARRWIQAARPRAG